MTNNKKKTSSHFFFFFIWVGKKEISPTFLFLYIDIYEYLIIACQLQGVWFMWHTHSPEWSKEEVSSLIPLPHRKKAFIRGIWCQLLPDTYPRIECLGLMWVGKTVTKARLHVFYPLQRKAFFHIWPDGLCCQKDGWKIQRAHWRHEDGNVYIKITS